MILCVAPKWTMQKERCCPGSTTGRFAHQVATSASRWIRNPVSDSFIKTFPSLTIPLPEPELCLQMLVLTENQVFYSCVRCATMHHRAFRHPKLPPRALQVKLSERFSRACCCWRLGEEETMGDVYLTQVPHRKSQVKKSRP